MLTYMETPGKYALGEDAFLGKWRIGSISWDAALKRGDPKKWRASCDLPGIKQNLGNFEKVEDAKAKLEKAAEFWLTGAGAFLKESIE